MAKKGLLIEYELEFLEKKLKELKKYIEDNPFSVLSDRIIYKMSKGIEMPTCLATKEAQRKDLAQAIKDYAEILITVQSLREKNQTEEIKILGDQEMPGMMRRKFQGQT